MYYVLACVFHTILASFLFLGLGMGTRDRGWYDREMTPPRLRKLGDLPLHLQFNSYILSGYRPPMDARGCARSLLYLHNESFNIYSHCT